ncbi:hypothetical protein [Nitratireductor sp. ZSWI3]|uniref:hypothetical protein n=1 Tax=Nitratireductor sp. ZSWI3 TaxID=2966359 RepID=UPI002150021D|nr:hypothetical protein [Nitratireductor sp. ZSWI3]MCR4266402.1 hypothetical protein [Nitratireductor sp. ZSWI3]
MTPSFTTRRIAIAVASLTMLSLSGLSTASVAGQLALAPQKAAGPTMNCSIPNNVVCTINSTKGLKLVKIMTNTLEGTVAIVNESYAGCPKQVQVHWDSAYQMSGKQIVECGGFKLKAR